MRKLAPVILGIMLLAGLASAQEAAASGNGPAYYEALMRYCYKGGLADRLGRDPDSQATLGPATKRAALKDLRKAKAESEAAVTALCVSGYYQAINAGYLTVVQR